MIQRRDARPTARCPERRTVLGAALVGMAEIAGSTRIAGFGGLGRAGAVAMRAGAALPLAAAAGTGDAGSPLRVGPGERFSTLREAVAAADDGATILLQPGEYVGDGAVIGQPRLTVRGLGPGAVLRAGDGRITEGKGLLVVRGGEVAIENLAFSGARAGGNGAGIRFERGRLAVRNCRFHDNENGLLANNRSDMELDVEGCVFGAAPQHPGLLHHLLYVGAIGRLAVSGSRFELGWRGHLLKSRARRADVCGNWLVDGAGGEASYELEFAEGGLNRVVGNVVVQAAGTQNPVVVSVGAEGVGTLPSRLEFSHNTLVNLAGPDAEFVRVWADRLPPGTPLVFANNLFAGPGALPAGTEGGAGGNRRVDLAALRDAAGGDFRLAADSPLVGAALPIDAALTPSHPPGRRLSPGALQAAD